MKEFRGTKGEWLVDDIDVISRETGFAICQVYDGLDTHISEMQMPDLWLLLLNCWKHYKQC